MIKQVRVNTVKDIITNSYIFYKNNEAMVIDPGGEPEKIIKELEETNCKLKYIVLTHCHTDHIGGISELKNSKGGKILISEKDGKEINNPIVNLAPFLATKMNKINIDDFLTEENIIEVGDEKFKIIFTPGHTKGGVCIYSENEKILFSGDTLFKGTYGRTDLPSGSHLDIMSSIKDKLLKLPLDTKVYPGHGAPTLIKDEIQFYE